VCGATPAPDPSPKPDTPRGGHSNGTDPPGRPADGGDDSTAPRESPGTNDQKVADTESGKPNGNKKKDNGKREAKDKGGDGYEPAIPTPSPSAAAVTSSNPAGATAEDTGAPVAAFLAIGLTAALGALGAVLVRRRRRFGEG
jgi:LPXTG-motif cell wall-anchored protein